MVESVALEMRSAGNGTEGSNPSLSSIFLFPHSIDHLTTGATTMIASLVRGHIPSPHYQIGQVQRMSGVPTITTSSDNGAPSRA